MKAYTKASKNHRRPTRPSISPSVRRALSSHGNTYAVDKTDLTQKKKKNRTQVLFSRCFVPFSRRPIGSYPSLVPTAYHHRHRPVSSSSSADVTRMDKNPIIRAAGAAHCCQCASVRMYTSIRVSVYIYVYERVCVYMYVRIYERARVCVYTSI